MRFLLQHLIDAVAARRPRHIAATCVDDSLSYADLATRSNQLANALAARNVRRHDRVGIFMDKSIATPVALYGILKTGAAYVPLDPAAPPERVARLLDDGGIRCVISADGKQRVLRALAKIGVELDLLANVTEPVAGWPLLTPAEVDASAAEQPPKVTILGDDLAYIMYTSGSTGTPKGIMHTHASGLAFARWAAAEYGLHGEDIISNHAPLHFDLSILDYFSGAYAGATTAIIPEEYAKLPASYAELVETQRMTVLYTVPFALIQLLLRGALDQRDLSRLRWVIFGGEIFPPAQLAALMRALPKARFDNIYGPAEVNGITHYTLPAASDPAAAVPIGPLAKGAEGLIVDDQGQPAVNGTPGELLVRTPTMMRGYWKRPDLNQKVFWRRTNAAGLQDVFFRTGDLVRDDGDGILHFIGRKDRQVKVRGYRVELDEIELALGTLDAVEEAAAYTLPDPDGSRRIEAQVTLNPPDGTSPADITRQLKKRLPWYAVPAAVYVAESFPRTSSGKIDRRHLRDTALASAATSHAKPLP